MAIYWPNTSIFYILLYNLLDHFIDDKPIIVSRVYSYGGYNNAYVFYFYSKFISLNMGQNDIGNIVRINIFRMPKNVTRFVSG